MRKIVCIILLAITVLPARVYAGIDPVRAALWEKYSFDSKEAMNAQREMQVLMATGHIFINTEEDEITDFQRQFNNYLSSFNNVIEVAAEVYGLYYEISKLSSNIKQLNDIVSKSPGNVLATAFSTKRNKVYINIVKTGIDLAKDIRKLCFEDDVKMTEKERILMLQSIRPKIKVINNQLRALSLTIKYTSFMDVWREIRGRVDSYTPKTRKEIAESCMKNWRDNGRLGH